MTERRPKIDDVDYWRNLAVKKGLPAHFGYYAWHLYCGCYDKEGNLLADVLALLASKDKELAEKERGIEHLYKQLQIVAGDAQSQHEEDTKRIKELNEALEGKMLLLNKQYDSIKELEAKSIPLSEVHDAKPLLDEIADLKAKVKAFEAQRMVINMRQGERIVACPFEKQGNCGYINNLKAKNKELTQANKDVGKALMKDTKNTSARVWIENKQLKAKNAKLEKLIYEPEGEGWDCRTDCPEIKDLKAKIAAAKERCCDKEVCWKALRGSELRGVGFLGARR